MGRETTVDPLTGEIEHFHDMGRDGFVIERVQDVEPVLEQCRRERSMDAPRGNGMRLAMRVPAIVIERICRETGLDFFEPDDAKAIMKILRSPAYKNFRVRGSF